MLVKIRKYSAKKLIKNSKKNSVKILNNHTGVLTS